MRKYILLIAFTAAVVSCLLVIPIGVKESYTKVDAVKAATADIITTVDCQGTIEPVNTSQVTVGVPVKISKCYFHVGDRVEKGEKLLSIDKETTLQNLMYSTGGAIVAGSASGAAGTNISTDDAETALKQAFSSGIIGESTYNSLLSQLQNSGSSTISLPSGANSSILDKLDLNIDDMLESVENSLYAPISGVITAITNSGQGMIPTGATLATIVDTSALQVKAQLNEENLKDVKVGQQVHISGSGFDGVYSGVVKQIYPVATSVSSLTDDKNMVNVIISIDKPGSNLIPGLTADVSIKVSEHRNAVTLPYDVIKQDDNGTEYVLVFDKGRAVKKTIKTGVEDNDNVEILEGIKNGEIVIKDPTDTITEGTNVRIS